MHPYRMSIILQGSVRYYAPACRDSYVPHERALIAGNYAVFNGALKSWITQLYQITDDIRINTFIK